MPIRGGSWKEKGGGGSNSNENYKGAWLSATNNPLLQDGIGTLGDYYINTSPGTNVVNFGSHSESFQEGDVVQYNGGIWQNVGVQNTASQVPILPITGTEGSNVQDVIASLAIEDVPVFFIFNANVITTQMIINRSYTYQNRGAQIYTLTFVGGATLRNPPTLNGSSTTAGFNPGDIFTFMRLSDNTISVR